MTVQSGDLNFREKNISVAIVNYGLSEHILSSLPALLSELDQFDKFSVFIVDNASPNNDGDALKAGLEKLDPGPNVHLVLSDVNGGFSAGNNVAFAEIRKLDEQPDAILLLNPDARVLPNSLQELVKVLYSGSKIGFVAPRHQNEDGSNFVAAFNFPTLKREFFNELGINYFAQKTRLTIPDVDKPTRVDWLAGTAVMIRKEAFEELGDMDEGYFLYYEEIDYMKQGINHGWESWHVPDAEIFHIGGAATKIVNSKVKKGRMPGYWFQSWARYFSKNHGSTYARAAGALKVLGGVLGDLQRGIRGKGEARPERYFRDFLNLVVFSRLSPPPYQVKKKALDKEEKEEVDLSAVSEAYLAAEKELGLPDMSVWGRTNDNPKDIGFWALVKEDFKTHDSNLFEQGFWAVFWHRFGNWRMGQPKLVRAPATLIYRTMFKLVEILCGISLWYTTRLGRRVRIWHHSGIILSARAIGDDVQIRQSTTFGVARTGMNAYKPIISSGVDIGAGACVIGSVLIGKDAKIGANSVVLNDVPDECVAVGIPAKLIKPSKATPKTEEEA